MKRIKYDPIGKTFGRLTVRSEVESIKNMRRVICTCTCGSEKIYHLGNLRSGKTTSCNCFRSELIANICRTHGSSGTVEYGIWTGIKTRCLNKNCRRWPSYGGRGIKICDRWLNSFESFFADMGPRPAGMSIERKDNNGNYEPSNCVWASKKEQSDNRRNSVKYTFNGKTLSLPNWARELGVSFSMLRRRHLKGMTAEQILDPFSRNLILENQ